MNPLLGKKFALFFLSAIFSISAFAQNGAISGTVTTSEGKAAASVTITLKGTSKGNTTDESGHYILRNVKPGSYTVVASLVGLASPEQTVTMTAGGKVTLDFILKENAAQLGEVIVTARNANKTTLQVAKMPLKNLENPQVYNSVSADLIKQQGIVNFDDAMRNVPGIARTWESTGRSGDGTAYFALRGFEAQPSLVNGLASFTNGDLDLANIEEIQVLKGPSGTLFGGAVYQYGGIINVVTKKPYFSTGGEISYQLGSFGMNRVSADYNTLLSTTEKIALRINTAYGTQNSFQDAGFKKTFFFSPALTYQVNDKLSFDVLLEAMQEERAVAPVFFNSDRSRPLYFKSVAALNLDPYQSFTSNDLPIKNPRLNLQAQMNYKFATGWNSQTVVSRSNSQAKGYYGYIFGNKPLTFDASGQPLTYDENLFEQYIHRENYTTSTFDIQQNFNGDFKLGSLRNRLLVGMDYFNSHIIDNGTGYAPLRYVTPQGGSQPFDPGHPVNLSRGSVDSLLAGTTPSHSNTSYSTAAVYVSDVINFTPNFSAMLSLRGDYFNSKGQHGDPSDDYHQFALSPKFGIVYQPIPNQLSLFANYMNAFTNIQPMQVTDASGNNPHIKSFKPQHADQYEFGVKTDLYADKLSITASYYNIKLMNRVTPLADNINDYDQRGAVRSKGFELSLDANPVQGLNLIAGYSHNHVYNIVGTAGDFYTEPGHSPGGQGPQDLANLWLTYKVQHGSLKNFGFGLGGNYASTYHVIDNTLTGNYDLPSYALLNASMFYNSGHVRVTLNGNNLTDKKYYIGYWSTNPQPPVTYTASIAFKF